MPTVLEIRQQRADLVHAAKSWLDKKKAEGCDVNSIEIDTEWLRRNNEIDALELQAKDLEREERMAALMAGLAEPQQRKTSPSSPGATVRNTAPTPEERNKILKAWAGHGYVSGSADGNLMHRAAELGMPLHQSSITLRSVNTGSSSAGGAATFVTTSPDLQMQLKYYSPIYSKVRVLTTSDGNPLKIPRATDISNSVSIAGQGTTAGESDPTFDSITLGGYYFRTVVQISYEMLQDSIFDVEAYVNQILAERFARTNESYIVNGTGSSQPTGLMTAAVAADGGTPAVTLGSGKMSFWSFDDLFNLFYSVDPAYRPGCTLVINDKSKWDLRKIKDSQGRYIWDVNNTLVQNAQPDTIAGFSYLISNSVPASGTASTNLGVFADLSRYYLRQVDGLTMQRLNERYAEQGLVGILAGFRWDGNYIGHANSIARVMTPSS